MNQIQLSDHELHGVLLNALSVAAERYRENADQMRKAAPLAAEAERVGKRPFLTERGALQLAEQFELKTVEVLELIDTIQEQADAG